MLKLFRRKLRQEKAPSETAPPPAPPEVTQPPAEAGAQPTSTKPRRRRGSRGGRNRRKPAGSATATETAKEEPKTAEKKSDRKPAQRSQSQRSQRQQQQRRRQPARRPPLPKAKRELLVSVDVGEQRVAVIEDDRAAEVYLERPERRSIAGNVYKGTVDNVLPGMEAAFIEIGLEKNGFLYVDEIVTPELEGRGGRKIQDLLKRNQEILVQAVKDPMKSKGARLTTEISLPGRFVVFVPSGEGLGVSRRLEDDERIRLRDIVKAIAPKKGGVIVRTAAEGASAEDIERDLVFLQKPLEVDRGERGQGEGACARLPGGRAAAPRHARPLHGRLREGARRPRPHVQAHRRLPEEDLAAHGRPRHPLPREDAALRGRGRRGRDQAPRSRAESTCRPAATSSSTTPRRSR